MALIRSKSPAREHHRIAGRQLHGINRVGLILRSAREEAGLSQRALAKKLRVHHSWVAKVELGERRLDVIEFIALARALGRDPKRLFASVARSA